MRVELVSIALAILSIVCAGMAWHFARRALRAAEVARSLSIRDVGYNAARRAPEVRIDPRFQCPYCPSIFVTEDGLAGHLTYCPLQPKGAA